LKILILNWRDIKNPKGGGAELLTHELAKRLVKRGHKVTQFSPLFLGAKQQEVYEGVSYQRKGTWWNIHLHAFSMYIRGGFGNPDIILDEVHWFPFFSALYARKKTVLFACEIANSLLYTLFPYPIAVVFRFFEKVYLFLYRNIPTLVISPSTYKDFIESGHNPTKITILPMGFNLPSIMNKEAKEKNPTIIYLARLNKLKGIYDAITSFIEIKKRISNAKLWVVGSGNTEIINTLTEQLKVAGILSSVTFHGFVNEKQKFSLLSRAHVLIVPSYQEGFGLTIPEAQLVGTVCVAYNSKGIKDIVKNNKTGILVKQSPVALTQAVIRILKNKSIYTNLKNAASIDVKKYSWENTADTAEKFIENL